VLDELRSAGVGGLDGRASAFASSGGEGSANATSGERGPHPVGASAMSGEWAATETGRTIARLAPSAFASSRPASMAGTLAGDDDLARRVAVGDDEDAVRRGAGDELGQTASSSPMSAAIAPSRPWPDACISRPRSRTRRIAVAERRAPAATSAEYWPIECPAANAGTGRRSVGRPALAERLEDRDRGGEDRGLGVLRRSSWSRAVPAERRDRCRRAPRRRPRRQRPRRGLGGEGAGHADGLRALAGNTKASWCMQAA
jgi:hypothetical protein